jgi:putative ABC transport system substrate-binding protein
VSAAATQAAPTVAALAPTVSAAATQVGAAAAAGKIVNIGIVQFTTHPALDASRDGARKALEDAGFVDGTTAHYDLQNGQGQIPTLTTIAQRYRDAKVDLVVVVSTPALQASANVFKDTSTPLVFNSVTDPYAAVPTIKSPTDKPANITGVQALPPVKDAMQLALKVVPTAKRFGIVWNPAEANSEVATRIARDSAKELNVELVEATVSSADEVLQGAQSLITKNIDVFFITTDSTVVSAIEALVRVANENKKPFFANDPATAQRGATAALGLDYYDQGYESGKLAAQILKGTPAAQVPILKAQKGSLSINLKAAELQGASLPPDVIAQAKDKFNDITPAKP